MNKLSFYEQVGIVIPGAVFLFGLLFYLPEVKDVLAKNGISVGGLGIFVIISYAIGQLLSALGNGIESLYWYLKGGMPSDWVVGPNPQLLSSVQIAKLEKLVVSRLGLTVPNLAEISGKNWFPIFRQIYSDVERYGITERGNTFNGNYGLNRGLCAASLALAVAVFIQAPTQWFVGLGFAGISLIYLYRMHRFGVHYAREIYNQFLLLPPEREDNKSKAGNN